MGDDIAKVFSGELYRGWIIDIDEDAEQGNVLYRVKYEDGDGEDLDAKDCVCAIKLYQDKENGVIDERTIGNE